MDDPGRLGAAIAREMVEIDREADGMIPAELRVGLDSIDARRDRTTRLSARSNHRSTSWSSYGVRAQGRAGGATSGT